MKASLLLLFCLSLALSGWSADIFVRSNSVGPADSRSDAASLLELNRNWPRFRGPDGGGVTLATNFPTAWNTTNDAGIAWKIPVPAPGFNSPIIYSNRIFFSGGDRKQREVFCLDATTGKLVWRKAVTGGPRTGEAFGVRSRSIGSALQHATAPEVPDSTGYAACTMATDGRCVYVIFATGDVAAFTFDGAPVWQRSFGPIKNPYGYATSLATWRDRLILQLDQGESDEHKSRLYALDGKTGKTIWEQPRSVGSSWATPLVIEAAGKAQIITLAQPWVIAYAAMDGAELWRVDCLNGEITPSPIFAGGLVIVVSPSEKLLAIRPDGHGDVTKTHVTWSTEENVPDVTSPVSNGELVFTLTTGGLLTCFDLKDGKKICQHDFDTECHSSPAIAGNNLYIFSQQGTAAILTATRQLNEVFRTQMGDGFHASPAFVDGRIFMKGMTNLWCLGSPASTRPTGPTGLTNYSK
ncbi:MAG: hypothetical protein C5B50_06915 [Verrucomicrobia bacterium]|nr:MAG: hypothetical protein C5B50_06915 [Verrucomicrobiota bacterium]